jgi:hypothetical protein
LKRGEDSPRLREEKGFGGFFGGAPNNTSEKRLRGLGKEARRVGYLWRCGGRGEVEEET